jgi:chaperonin GroEL
MTNIPQHQQTTNSSQKQEVVFEEKAHEEILKGATILAKAVRSTMGPSGHGVIIDYKNKAPLITKDGVTVAKSINLKDKMQNIGAELLKEIASKTNELSGDGTTTATVLGHGLLAQGIKMIATGRSAIGLKKGIDLGCKEVIDFLKENCVPVSSEKDIVAIGTISANGDQKIGELLSDAINKVGADGIITVEPAKSVNTQLEVVEGLQIESGYLSPYFVTNGEKLVCELREPYILLTNRRISSLDDIVPVLETVYRAGKPLLIVADEIEGEALHTLIVNKMKEKISVCAIKAPSYGENRTDILQDINCVIGGKIIDLSSETQLKNIQLAHFGTCKKVIVSRTATTIIGSSDSKTKEAIAGRMQMLRNTLSDGTLDDLHTNRFRKRLAKLSGGVAVIKVGGSTEVEILEKKDRVEDALNATIAATQEGIVPGGGSALFYAALHLRKMLVEDEVWKTLPEDVAAGIQVVANTCELPLRTIVENTGTTSEIVVAKLKDFVATNNLSLKKKRKMDIGHKNIIEWDNPLLPSMVFKEILGYDAANHEYGDLLGKGIIDPVKVTRYALEHACSVIGLVLTCSAVIINQEEE